MLFSAEWLRIRRTSPLTNTPISADVLIPNHTLKKVIDAWQDSIKEAPLGVPVTPRDEAFDSPHLVEVSGDELEAIKIRSTRRTTRMTRCCSFVASRV